MAFGPITAWQIEGEKVEAVTDFYSHEIRKQLLLGRKARTNLDILWTKIHIVKAMVFPVATYSCESWTVKEAEHWRIDAFKLWYSILKEINPETLWKDLCWSWSSNSSATWCEHLTDWKRPWCWERLKAEGEEGDRGWEAWMVSLIQGTWTWANSGR